MKKNNKDKIQRILKAAYLQVFRANANPFRLALGFGLGVFAGILPGTGPIAAVVLATLFRVHKLTALLGSLITNTWITVVAFLFSIKTSAWMFGIDYQKLLKDWQLIVSNFEWQKLLDVSILKLIFIVASGFVMVAFILGMIGFVLSLIVILIAKKISQKAAKGRSL